MKEALIERLIQVLTSASGPNDPWSALADEVIRQMRWIAAEVAHDYRSNEGFDSRRDAEKDARERPLTLAPEDWQP